MAAALAPIAAIGLGLALAGAVVISLAHEAEKVAAPAPGAADGSIAPA